MTKIAQFTKNAKKELLFVYSTGWIFFFEEKKVSLGKCFVLIVDSLCDVELLYNSGTACLMAKNDF